MSLKGENFQPIYLRHNCGTVFCLPCQAINSCKIADVLPALRKNEDDAPKSYAAIVEKFEFAFPSTDYPVCFSTATNRDRKITNVGLAGATLFRPLAQNNSTAKPSVYIATPFRMPAQNAARVAAASHYVVRLQSVYLSFQGDR